MREIISPFNDDSFNSYLLKYVKARLKKRALLFIGEYEFEGKTYTSNDIIKSIKRQGRKIFYSDYKLITYIIYDLSQRFWSNEFRDINNIIRGLYCEYCAMKNQEDSDLNKKKSPIRTIMENS